MAYTLIYEYQAIITRTVGVLALGGLDVGRHREGNAVVVDTVVGLVIGIGCPPLSWVRVRTAAHVCLLAGIDAPLLGFAVGKLLQERSEVVAGLVDVERTGDFAVADTVGVANLQRVRVVALHSIELAIAGVGSGLSFDTPDRIQTGSEKLEGNKVR